MFSSMLLPLIPAAIMVIVAHLLVRRFKNRGRYSPFTDDFLREPGETLRTQHSDIQDDIMEALYSIMVFGILLVYLLKGSSLLVAAIALLIFTALFIYQLRKLSRLFSKAVNVRLGFEGERATGQELMMLMRDGAWVYHDLPYKYGNIDHIVIAPGGVFASEKPTAQNGRLHMMASPWHFLTKKTLLH